MKGFRNIGNTCYLNSGLQMLVRNKDLCCLISEYSMESEKLKLIDEFIKQYYDESNNNILIPIKIKQLVETEKNIFFGMNQQDSTEFIMHLLDIIDEEIKNIEKRLNQKKTGISKLFGIKSNVRIKCKLRSCLNISNTKEFNNVLLLDLNDEKQNQTLDDIYMSYKSGIKLDGDNMYYCDKCKDKRIASKRHTIEEWPKHLFIWLKRFKLVGHRFMKNDQQIDIPLKWNHNYELQGAVIHGGNLNGGHYTYINKYNDEWYIFNDASVNKINDIELNKLLNNAYWIYYKQN